MDTDAQAPQSAATGPNFCAWLFNSHTVRVGQRFSKTGKFIVYNVARGKKAGGPINSLNHYDHTIDREALH